MNEIRWAVSQSAIAVMILVALFTVVLPLGLGLWFRRRTGGRWRFFLLGAVIFPLFALVLEGSVNRAVLLGSVWKAMLYGKGYLYYATTGLVKNTLMLPLEVFLTWVVLRAAVQYGLDRKYIHGVTVR